MSGQKGRLLLIAALGAAVTLAGCGGDARLEKLTQGMPRDSAAAAMGVEKAHRVDAFLVKGQYIEALYYARPGSSPTDSIPDRKMSPLVVINGKLAAWGWKQWDSIAAANRIMVPK